MNNIFENAKFGDMFRTSAGVKHLFCSFTKDCNGEKLARLYREGWGTVIFHLDGSIHSEYEFGRGDIERKYVEPIDEDKLDELARKERYNSDGDFWVDGFKAGYRKAKQE